MQPITKQILLSIILFLPSLLFSQGVTFKPLAGYHFPRMTDVNADIQGDVRILLDGAEGDLPAANTFGGDISYGGEIEYHIGEDYFAAVHLSFYQQNADTRYASASPQQLRLDYLREVKMYNYMLILRQYFNYNTWRRTNFYFGLGVGLVQANAVSNTLFEFDNTQQIDTDGEFSRAGLSVLGSLGGDLRIAQPFRIWAEAGYQYSNLGQLDGFIVSRDENGQARRSEVTTESSFDLSGFFIRGGLGITLPFLN